MESPSKVSHKVLSAQSREIVLNVTKCFKEEAAAGQLTIPIQKVQERTAKATGVSVRTIRRIQKQSEGLSPTLSTLHNKKRPRPKSAIEDIDQSVLRRLIHNFYLTKKAVPSLRKIHAAFQEAVGYSGGKDSMRNILRKLGFRWRKNRTLLIEKHEIRVSRIQYLRRIKQYREEARPIVYMDETFIRTSQTHLIGWMDDSQRGALKPLSKVQPLVVMHAGGEMGFIPNSLLMFRSQTGDYRSEMSFEEYRKWLQEMLIPNLPKRSVFVIENTPYHNVQIDKIPTVASSREDMRKWLTEKNICNTPDMLKTDLYDLVRLYKPKYKTHNIDSLLSSEGHTVLRLPPCHADLNPIQLVQSALKHYVVDKNVTFGRDDLDNLCREFFSTYSLEQWKSCCDHVKEYEQKYMNNESQLDAVMDDIISGLGVDCDSDDDSNSDDSDSDNDSNSD